MTNQEKWFIEKRLGSLIKQKNVNNHISSPNKHKSLVKTKSMISVSPWASLHCIKYSLKLAKSVPEHGKGDDITVLWFDFFFDPQVFIT